MISSYCVQKYLLDKHLNEKNILGEFYILFTGEFSLWSGIKKDFLKTLKETQIDLTVVPPYS